MVSAVSAPNGLTGTRILPVAFRACLLRGKSPLHAAIVTYCLELYNL